MLKEWLDGGFDLIVCPHLLDETRSTLNRDKFRRYVSLQEADGFIDILARLAVVWEDPKEIPRATADPDDDYLVALARSAAVDVLVSGDKHLTQQPELQELVMSPRDLLRTLTP